MFQKNIAKKFHLTGTLIPPTPLYEDLFTGGQILDSTFSELIQGSRVTPIHGEIASFSERGLTLHTMQFLPADLVLYCTGYTKSYDYMEGAVKVSKQRYNTYEQ